MRYKSGVVKLLSWNLLHGGGDRRDAICSAIVRHDPDVIALSEVRARSVSEIRSSIWLQPWQHHAAAPFKGNTNGVCILSRAPLTVRNDCPVPEENSARWLDVEVPAFELGIGALHIPTDLGALELGGGSKRRFWAALVEASRARMNGPFIFVGDLNTGRRGSDEHGRTFICDKEFDQMTAIGWTDAWRHFHGTEFEPSWVSNQGNGFRIDHAFVSPALLPRLTSCQYSHAERVAGISDHSMLIIELQGAHPA
jgi:exonuclease III